MILPTPKETPVNAFSTLDAVFLLNVACLWKVLADVMLLVYVGSNICDWYLHLFLFFSHL